MAVIEKTPRSATVTARTDCKFVIVNEERFLCLIDESPSFAIEIMRVIAQRLRKINLQIFTSYSAQQPAPST